MVKRLTLRQLVERVARRSRLAGFVISVVALAHLQSGPRGVMLKQFQDFQEYWLFTLDTTQFSIPEH